MPSWKLTLRFFGHPHRMHLRWQFAPADLSATRKKERSMRYCAKVLQPEIEPELKPRLNQSMRC